MSVLIPKNTIKEGPGTIEDFLKQEKFSYTILELESGEIPPTLENFTTLIILGGPMGVYEMDKYPHLKIGSRIIREAINRDMKIMGICLGSQMIAHCLGADVYPGHKKEIGWYHIELTGEGLKDPLMRKFAIHPRVGDFWRRFKVFHWHADTFDLPHGSVLLASTKLYKNQAFRFGENIYAFQFHIEVKNNMIYEWFKDTPDCKLILEETENVYYEYYGRAMNFYKKFFKK
ncbi:MAG: type 1 glutamine amidotransferase [Nitrospirae bacterium]|nr:type 1 glutamine amidotransferase [Nitrospirota bacterium]